MRGLIAFFLVVLTSCTSLQVQEKPPTARYLYDNITIEIQQTDSIGVVQSNLTALKNSLHKYRICRKNRISIIVKNPVPAPAAWTRETMLYFKRKHRTLFDRNPHDRHLIVHISLLPGIYLERGGNIIGLAFKSNQYIALFNNFSHYVLLHEFGHLIGLVDRSHRKESPRNSTRPNHCNRKSCVMFWRASRLGKFDDRCLKDIDRMISERN